MLLKQIAEISAGQGAPQGDSNYCTSGIPFVKAGNLFDLINGLSIYDIQKVSEDVANRYKLKKYKKGSIVFAKSGMSCLKGYVYVLPCDTYVVSHLAIITPYEHIEEYLKYYFIYNKPNSLIKDAAYPSISLNDIGNMQIDLKNEFDRRKIVSSLDTVTHTIDCCNAILEKLDMLVKSRFVEMFGDNKYPIVKTSDICDFITKGTTPPANEIFEEYSDGMIPYLKVYNLSFTGDLLFKQIPQFISKTTHEGKLSRSKVYPNDVLMNIVGPPLGKFSVVTNDYPEWNINQAIAIFRAKEKVIPQYLMSALMQPDVLRPFLEQAVGIRQLNLSLEQCRNLEIPLPPLALQQQFAAFVEQNDKSKSAVKKLLEKAETLKKALMQEYFG